jgi:hypothetical protein
MVRSVSETARILAHLYDKSFGGDESERYRIGWPELRGIAGVKRLDGDFLRGVNDALMENGYLLVTCDNYFVVAGETDFARDRKVPQRLVERYLYEAEDEELEDDCFEDDDEEDED